LLSEIFVDTRTYKIDESKVPKHLQLLSYLGTYVVIIAMLFSQFVLERIYFVKLED